MVVGRYKWLLGFACVVSLVLQAAPASSAVPTKDSYRAGYEVTIRGITSASASFRVTKVTCTGEQADVFHLVELGNNIGAGLDHICTPRGDLVYLAMVRVNASKYWTLVKKPAAVGDQIIAAVRIDGGTVTSTVRNRTQNWTVSESGPADDTPRDATFGSGKTWYELAQFEPVHFTFIRAGGRRLLSQLGNVYRLHLDDFSHAEIDTSDVVNGDRFTNTWLHS